MMIATTFPSSINTAIMPPKPRGQKIRSGFTPLQKYELCCLREKHPTMRLTDFALLAECPKRVDGRPLAQSSPSDHLKGWQDRVKQGPPEGTSY